MAAPSASLPFGGKCGRTSVPAHDAQKRLKREDSPVGVVPRTPTSFQKEIDPSTLLDTGSDPESVATSGSVPRESGGSPAHRAALVGAGTSAGTTVALQQKLAKAEERIADLESKLRHLYKIHDRAEETADQAYAHAGELRERVVHLEVLPNRVQGLELCQARLDGQLDFLLRLQHPSVALPLAQPSVPAPPNPHGPGRDTA